MAPLFLLLAAALCVAPWQSVADARLAALAPLRATGRPSLMCACARLVGQWRLPPALRSVSARVGRGRSGSPDPAVLAQLLDLVAAALTAGLPAPEALAAVADALDGSRPVLAGPLRSASARMRLGATAAEAWRHVPGAEPLGPVVAVLVRACEGGGSVRAALGHVADRMRSEADAAATARAERAAVMVAGPLGLCFLPAFVCLGVLPVVIGLADGMLPGFGTAMTP